jgi:hypothetical protein
MFNVSYQPPNSTPRIEHYPTEEDANNRAHFLRTGMRYHQVVVCGTGQHHRPGRRSVMGTNFYALEDATCDNEDHRERLHIGKRSGGWKFGFRAHPERGIVSWEDWRRYLFGRTIVNEYGETFRLADIANIVAACKRPWGPNEITPRCRVTRGDDREWHDSEGNDFYSGEFS